MGLHAGGDNHEENESLIGSCGRFLGRSRARTHQPRSVVQGVTKWPQAEAAAEEFSGTTRTSPIIQPLRSREARGVRILPPHTLALPYLHPVTRGILGISLPSSPRPLSPDIPSHYPVAMAFLSPSTISPENFPPHVPSLPCTDCTVLTTEPVSRASTASTAVPVPDGIMPIMVQMISTIMGRMAYTQIKLSLKLSRCLSGEPHTIYLHRQISCSACGYRLSWIPVSVYSTDYVQYSR